MERVKTNFVDGETVLHNDKKVTIISTFRIPLTVESIAVRPVGNEKVFYYVPVTSLKPLQNERG